MVLSDRDIRRQIAQGRIVVDPYDDDAVQPASVDLRLGTPLLVEETAKLALIDPRQQSDMQWRKVELDESVPYPLQPGEFALGITAENIEIPDDIVGRLDGKSSLGRLGLVVHSTAGFVDPGWRGKLTLELSNLSSIPINLYLGMKSSQLSFVWLSSPAERPYGSKGLNSKYQGQMEPVPSRFYQNYTPQEGASGHAQRQRGHDANPELRAWFHASEYEGNVAGFAAALGVNQRTVEEWVYGRARPSTRQWAALHRVTGLSAYSSRLLLPDEA